MLMLLARNPRYNKHRVYGRYFTEMFPIVTKENTKKVLNKFVRKVDKWRKFGNSWRKVYNLTTNFENVVGGKITIPKRVIFRTHGVTRIFSLNSKTWNGNIVYKSMVGDYLTLLVD
jgi:hypothetical protein